MLNEKKMNNVKKRAIDITIKYNNNNDDDNDDDDDDDDEFALYI